MAFNTLRRAASISPGFGSPIKNYVLFTNSATISGTSTQATTVPSTGSFVPTVCRGWILVHIYGGGGTSPTAVLQSITGTDGTSTVVLFAVLLTIAAALSSGLSATVAGSGLSILIPFETDLNLTTITVNTIMGGTSPTGTLDIDVAGTTN